MSPKVLRVSKPASKGEIDTYFIAGDWHEEFCHEPSVNILIQHAQLIPRKNRKLIINGDFIDLPHLMTKDLNKFKPDNVVARIESHYLPLTKKEFRWANAMLDRLGKTFDYKNIIFGIGNHDWRADNFKERYAPGPYKKEFDLKENLHLKSRGIRSYDYNAWLDLGNLSITHGMYHGNTALLKHYNACGRNVVFSHVHQIGVKSFVRRGESVMAASLPCMSSLNPEYLKNAENNWSNGYGVVNLKHNGNFNFHIMSVWDDELILPNGKRVSGAVSE